MTIGHSVSGEPILASRYGTGQDVTLIMGGFHGDEPGSTAVCRELEGYLQAHPEACDGQAVLLVPAVNPDGLAAGTRANARGVDLNRNWPEGWERAPTGKLSHGEAPLSEPEAQAIARLLEDCRPQKVINLHQQMNMLNPTGARGLALAEEMQRHNGLRIDEGVGYPTPGCFGDYCGRQLGLAMVTYELPAGENPWESAREALLAAITFALPA